VPVGQVAGHCMKILAEKECVHVGQPAGHGNKSVAEKGCVDARRADGR
jgi:hypothetical protein